MPFETEPAGYEKTILSDLQGAWINLRAAVVENFGFPDSERMLFHIDEGMSWESVRNLRKMESALLLIRNISMQTEMPNEVDVWIKDVGRNLAEALSEVAEGRA